MAARRGVAALGVVLLLGACLVVVRRHGGSRAELQQGGGAPSGLPRAFAEEAERTRLETAIRLDASKLERDQDAKGKFDKLYTESAAKAEAEGQEAAGLLAQGRGAANQAVERRAAQRVAESQADTDRKEEAIDKRTASLMARRAQSLREHAKHRAFELEGLEKQVAMLEAHKKQLLAEAQKQGRQSEAVIATADNLLSSARAMSQRGAAASKTTGLAGVEESKEDRLRAARREAREAMESDMERLARAKIAHKRLTGVEGVDELSRAQEAIGQLDKKLQGTLPT